MPLLLAQLKGGRYFLRRSYHIRSLTQQKEADLGLYKWKEKSIFIKKDSKYDFGLLLVELIHSQSITQGNPKIKKWISEGLPHFLAKKFCESCGIYYRESGYRKYISFWKDISKHFDVTLLKSTLFRTTINQAISELNQIFNYQKSDILEIDFKEAIKLWKSSQKIR